MMAGTGRNWRQVLALLALLAFAVQGFALQTHIHGDPAGASPAVLQTTPGTALPGQLDPANCPLCQEIMHGGVFTAPALFVLLLAIAIASFAFAHPAPVRQTRTQGWQSRAPPRR